MGVPSFFRWLIKKYPLVLADCIVEKPEEEEESTLPAEQQQQQEKNINPEALTALHPVDTSLPNLNGAEYDTLFLDMNGIIHRASHPDGQVPGSKHSLNSNFSSQK